MVLDKDKKIKMQQDIIDNLTKENQELKEQLEYEQNKPDLMIQKAKSMMELLEEKRIEYESLIAELKEKREQFRSHLDDFRQIKTEYKKHIQNGF